MIAVRDSVGTGLIASLPRPGGNVTGVSGSAGLEIVAKQLELLKETVPKIRRVAILSNPANAYHQLAIREVNVAARSLGVQLQLLEARGPNEFDGAFAAMATERVGALLVLSDAIFNSHRTRPAADCLQRPLLRHMVKPSFHSHARLSPVYPTSPRVRNN